MDKVQVTQEIVDALKACDGLNQAFLISEIGKVFYGADASNSHTSKLACLLKAQYSFEDAVEICFGEYIIAKTPEEEIAEIYNSKVNKMWEIHHEGVRQGIRYVAIAFNLKIKGVNC